MADTNAAAARGVEKPRVVVVVILIVIVYGNFLLLLASVVCEQKTDGGDIYLLCKACQPIWSNG